MIIRLFISFETARGEKKASIVARLDVYKWGQKRCCVGVMDFLF